MLSDAQSGYGYDGAQAGNEMMKRAVLVAGKVIFISSFLNSCMYKNEQCLFLSFSSKFSIHHPPGYHRQLVSIHFRNRAYNQSV